MSIRVWAIFLGWSLHLLSHLSFAQSAREPVNAVVQRINEEQVWVNVLTSGGHEQALVRPLYASARNYLLKLKVGDFFQGLGRVEKDSQGEGLFLLLESVDFVGLRQLIGLWRAQDAFLRFENYDQLEIKTLTNRGLKRARFSYSLAPSPEAKTWMVFIHGEEGVTLGHINFASWSRATLKLFDVEQDQSLTLKLMRVSP